MTATDAPEAAVALPAPAKVIAVGAPRELNTGRWTITATAYITSRPITDLHMATIERATQEEARAEAANLVEALTRLTPWGNDDDVEVRLP